MQDLPVHSQTETNWNIVKLIYYASLLNKHRNDQYWSLSVFIQEWRRWANMTFLPIPLFSILKLIPLCAHNSWELVGGGKGEASQQHCGKEVLGNQGGGGIVRVWSPVCPQQLTAGGGESRRSWQHIRGTQGVEWTPYWTDGIHAGGLVLSPFWQPSPSPPPLNSTL